MKLLTTCILALLGTLIVLTGCIDSAVNEPAQGGLIYGAKIYTHEGDMKILFDEWSHLGFNTIVSSVELNQNEEFRKQAATHNIDRFIILPTFQDPAALERDPSLWAITREGKRAESDWVKFVCPSRKEFRAEKIAAAAEIVRECSPAGISIDFIRHFVFWETVFPDRTLETLPNTCFCDHCMERFQEDTGIAIPLPLETPSQKAEWLLEHHLDAWTAWKCGLITSMVDELVDAAKEVNPDIKVNLHSVPWRRDDFGGARRIVTGQDLVAISEMVDYISPMTYSHMVKQEPEWAHSVVADMAEQVSCPIVPSIQVSRAYLDEEFTREQFAEALSWSLQAPSHGVVFWSWDALNSAPDKKAIVQKMLGK